MNTALSWLSMRIIEIGVNTFESLGMGTNIYSTHLVPQFKTRPVYYSRVLSLLNRLREVNRLKPSTSTHDVA